LDYLRNGCQAIEILDPIIKQLFDKELEFWQLKIEEEVDQKKKTLQRIFDMKPLIKTNVDLEMTKKILVKWD